MGPIDLDLYFFSKYGIHLSHNVSQSPLTVINWQVMLFEKMLSSENLKEL